MGYIKVAKRLYYFAKYLLSGGGYIFAVEMSKIMAKRNIKSIDK